LGRLALPLRKLALGTQQTVLGKAIQKDVFSRHLKFPANAA
jgi:hypothetical protein